jgi:hypothetical protein
MKYADFKNMIQAELLAHPFGATWKQLKDDLDLPYAQPCPEWTRCLEQEIGLVRRKGTGKAFIWSLKPKRTKSNV